MHSRALNYCLLWLKKIAATTIKPKSAKGTQRLGKSDVLTSDRKNLSRMHKDKVARKENR